MFLSNAWLSGWYDTENWDNSSIVLALKIILFTALGAAAIASAISLAALLVRRNNPRAYGALKISLLALVVIVLGIGLFYIDANIDDDDQTALFHGMRALTYGLCAIAFVGILFGFRGKDNAAQDTRELTFAATCIALSFALSNVALWKMPQGGSVTLGRMLPLAVYCFYFGWKKGLLAGFVYSLLELMQDPWIYNVWQVMLDYIVPFTAIAIVGLFSPLRKTKNGKWWIIAGLLVYSCIRFVCHLLTGAYIFAAQLDEPLVGGAAWIYSATYNSVVFVDIAFAIGLGIALFSTDYFPKYMERYLAGMQHSRKLAPVAAAEQIADPDAADCSAAPSPNTVPTQSDSVEIE